MAIRVLMITAPVSSPKNWKYESNILLSYKLARYLATHMAAHVHFVVPDLGDVSFLAPCAGVTIYRLPAMFDNRTVSGMGCMPEPGEIVKLIREVGPDVIAALNSRASGLLGCILEADNLWRTGAVEVPLLLWDLGPIGYDIIERGAESGGPLAAVGQVAASQVWCASQSHVKANSTEVIRSFGFAQAQSFNNKAVVCSFSVDREYMDSLSLPNEKRPTFTVHIGGRWSATKGYPLVVDAVFKLKASGEDISLLNTGMIAKDPVFRRAISEMGMEAINGLTQEEMWSVARTCHVGVLAQKTQWTPGLPIEQLALGLPVLVRSTERIADVMPQYPLVWTTVEELMALLLDVRNDYAGACSVVGAWWEEHWQRYDISKTLPVMVGLTTNLRTVTVPVKLSKEGVIDVAERGTTMTFAKQSILTRVMARREAAMTGRYIEDIQNSRPVFAPVDEAGDAGDGSDVAEQEVDEDE